MLDLETMNKQLTSSDMTSWSNICMIMDDVMNSFVNRTVAPCASSHDSVPRSSITGSPDARTISTTPQEKQCRHRSAHRAYLKRTIFPRVNNILVSELAHQECSSSQVLQKDTRSRRNGAHVVISSARLQLQVFHPSEPGLSQSHHCETHRQNKLRK